MNKNQTKVTKSEMESVSNLVEDVCAEPSCGMTILVDKDLKEHGRHSRCMSCLMKEKLGRKIV